MQAVTQTQFPKKKELVINRYSQEYQWIRLAESYLVGGHHLPIATVDVALLQKRRDIDNNDRAFMRVVIHPYNGRGTLRLRFYMPSYAAAINWVEKRLPELLRDNGYSPIQFPAALKVVENEADEEEAA